MTSVFKNPFKPIFLFSFILAALVIGGLQVRHLTAGLASPGGGAGRLSVDTLWANASGRVSAGATAQTELELSNTDNGTRPISTVPPTTAVTPVPGVHHVHDDIQSSGGSHVVARSKSRRLYQRTGDAVATIGLTELIREHDNRLLAPMFQGMVLAPQLTWRTLIFATANIPVDDVDNRMLHLAARSGNHFYAWCLVENGADPLVTNAGHQTALQAVQGSHAELQTMVAQCILDCLGKSTIHLSTTLPSDSAATWDHLDAISGKPSDDSLSQSHSSTSHSSTSHSSTSHSSTSHSAQHKRPLASQQWQSRIPPASALTLGTTARL